jgi:hypothetical protein
MIELTKNNLHKWSTDFDENGEEYLIVYANRRSEKITLDAFGFIAKPDFYGHEYTVFCFTGLTNGNGWSRYKNTDLTNIVDSLLQNNFRLFISDNWFAAMNWIHNNVGRTELIELDTTNDLTSRKITMEL